ncbi:TetR/AcrR family transcriptional regulator [Weeksellaceae bacterium TAE3-ERU29]|nr:TetR/AcrR family transcriptional regulator [Weeksellaceae bacterium TAE3-ERU29]
MKGKILTVARKLFLKFGYRTVTMDDIAEELGISKKTLYENYNSKNKLIEDVVQDIFENVESRLNENNYEKELNAIERIYKMSQVIDSFFNVTSRKPMREMEKYYPEIHKKVQIHIEEKIKKYLYKNIQEGISEGVYRKEVDIQFFFYFFLGIEKNGLSEQIYPEDKFNLKYVESKHLEYMIRILVTPKGQEILEEILKNNQ